MIITADMGSILFQIFIIWLLSSIFSGKNKKKDENKSGFLKKNIEKFFRNATNLIENKLSEYKIILEDSDDLFIDETKEADHKIVQSEGIEDSNPNPKEFRGEIKNLNSELGLKYKLGLNSKSTIRNAIIINEILKKPVSLRK